MRFIKMNENQLARLRKLETRLKLCLETGEVDLAVEITADIQSIFGEDRTHHRLLKAKLWCFETCLLANRHGYAESGLIGIVRASGKSTKIHLEANFLLAICYLREKDVSKAKPLIKEVVDNVNKIKSDRSRRLFQSKILSRLGEECILSELISENTPTLNTEEIHNRAVLFVQNSSDEEIAREVASNLPPSAKISYSEVRRHTLEHIPKSDAKLLPDPDSKDSETAIGLRAIGAMKRIAWRRICDPNSKIYKAWSAKLPEALGPGFITAGIVESFKDWKIGGPMLVSAVAATILKSSASYFCKRAKPDAFMTDRSEIMKSGPP